MSIKLNKFLIKATLKEFADGLKLLKGLENTVADETYIQMVGTVQNQYIQMLIRLKTMHSGFTNRPLDNVREIAHILKEAA